MLKTLTRMVVIIFLLSACTAAPQAVKPGTPQAQTGTQPAAGGSYPAPGLQSGYPHPAAKNSTPAPTNAGSDMDHFVFTTTTAFQGLPVAEQEAKKWRPGAALVQIPRLRQMEGNLALPKGPNGWFYMFMDATNPKSALELYVEVAGGKVVGKSEVQQLYTDGKRPYKQLPIDFNKKLLDSNQAYQVFLDNMGKDYIKGKGRVEIDLQLVHLEGTENPVWSIYKVDDTSGAPLYNLDAVTGKPVDDPFAAFRK